MQNMQNVQNTQNIDMQKSKISESELSINSRTCLGHLVLFVLLCLDKVPRPSIREVIWAVEIAVFANSTNNIGNISTDIETGHVSGD